MQWFYASDGQQKGPVSDEEFKKLARDGVIRADTLVWRAGLPNWQPFAQVAQAGQAAPMPAVASGAPAEDADTAVCAVSGQRHPKREMIQYEDKWVSAKHRDEFFQHMREGVALPGDFSAFGFGGFWRRFAARFVDGIITGVAGLLMGAVIGGAMGAMGGLQHPVAFQAVIQLLSVAMVIGYEIFFIRKYDATPGKMALGLKILRTDGSSLTAGRTVGRYFATLLSSLTLTIGFIMAAFDDEKRALHDRVCDTRVVKTR